MAKYKYFNVLKAINDNFETQRRISKMLGITEVSFRNKLSGKTEWTIGEIETLCSYFNQNYYELFKKE